jgi:acetyl-CoA carboxylase biotin carboxyl carrier protein
VAVKLDELKEIIKLLKAEGLSEITLREPERLITVKQEGAVVTQGEAPTPVGSLRNKDAGTITVSAPLVGTFYRRPSPDAEPFVEQGAQVDPGDTLCIIEAMKVMNEIKAENAGRLRQTLVEDGEAVQYGQPLFLFERP